MGLLFDSFDALGLKVLGEVDRSQNWQYILTATILVHFCPSDA